MKNGVNIILESDAVLGYEFHQSKTPCKERRVWLGFDAGDSASDGAPPALPEFVLSTWR